MDSFFNITSDIVDDVDAAVGAGSGASITVFIFMAWICIVIALNIMGNTGTIAAFAKVRSLRDKPSDLLILNLSVADLGFGFMQLMLLPVSLQLWPWGKFGCQLNVLVGNACFVAGLYTTVCISLDRYLLISKSYPVYMKMQTKTRMYSYMVFIWACAILFGIVELILWDIVEVPGLGRDPFEYTRACRSPPKHTFVYSMTIFALTIFLPLALIEIFSITFVIILRKRLQQRARVGDVTADNTMKESLSLDASAPGIAPPNHPVENNIAVEPEFTGARSCGSTNPVNASGSSRDGAIVPDVAARSAATNTTTKNASGTRNRYTKAAVTLGALVVAVNVCVLPFIMYVIVGNLFCPECNSGTIRDILVNILYMNSCLNPILYAATMSKIRRFYKGIFCRRN